MGKRPLKIISIFLCCLLIFQQTGFAQVAGLELNIAGRFATLANTLFPDKFRPLHLRSISYDGLNNNFKLLLDKGDAKNSKTQDIESTTKDLLNYFFVGIALPNDTFWVNLRPDSSNDVIDPLLAQTEVGKILLEADLQLKKDTANATNPGTIEGKEYWDKLYQKASEIYGNQNVTIPTLTRPWIVPDEIIIRESVDSAYVYKATLKVMLEQDYLKGSATYSFKDKREKQLNEYSSQIIREEIIPKLTREINNAKRYAPLRQVYYSLILAQWFKARSQNKNTQYAGRIDKKDLTNLQSQIPYSVNTYFNAYKENFAKGEYNLKEPVFTPSGQVIRSYFSGGVNVGQTIPLTPGKTPTSVNSLGTKTTEVPFVNDFSAGINTNNTLTQVRAREAPDGKLELETSFPVQGPGQNLNNTELVSEEMAEKNYQVVFDTERSLGYFTNQRASDPRLMLEAELEGLLTDSNFKGDEYRDFMETIYQSAGLLKLTDPRVARLQADLDEMVISVNRKRAKNLDEQGRPNPLPPIPKARVLVVLNDAIPNAFSMPDGTLVINQSLINIMESQDEVAAVLAHELTHYVRRFDGAVQKALMSADALTSEAFAKRLGEYDADSVQSILADLQYHTLAMRSALGNMLIFFGKGGSDITHGGLITRMINQVLEAKFIEAGGGGKISKPLEQWWKTAVVKSYESILYELPPDRIEQLLNTGKVDQVLLSGLIVRVRNLFYSVINNNAYSTDPETIKTAQTYWTEMLKLRQILLTYIIKNHPSADDKMLAMQLFYPSPDRGGGLVYIIQQMYNSSDYRGIAEQILDDLDVINMFTVQNIQHLSDDDYWKQRYSQLNLVWPAQQKARKFLIGSGRDEYEGIYLQLLGIFPHLRAEMLGLTDFTTEEGLLTLDENFGRHLLTIEAPIDLKFTFFRLARNYFRQVIERMRKQSETSSLKFPQFDKGIADKIIIFAHLLDNYGRLFQLSGLNGILAQATDFAPRSWTLKSQYEDYFRQQLGMEPRARQFVDFITAVKTQDNQLLIAQLESNSWEERGDFYGMIRDQEIMTQSRQQWFQKAVLDWLGVANNVFVATRLNWEEIRRDFSLMQFVTEAMSVKQRQDYVNNFLRARKAGLQVLNLMELEELKRVISSDFNRTSIVDNRWEYSTELWSIVRSWYLNEVEQQRLTWLKAYQDIKSWCIGKSLLGTSDEQINYLAPFTRELLMGIASGSTIDPVTHYSEAVEAYQRVKLLDDSEERQAILMNMAKRIIDKANFDQALDFVIGEMLSNTGKSEVILWLLRSRIVTFEEYDLAERRLGKSFKDAIGGKLTQQLGGAVLMDTVVDSALSSSQAMRFFEAAVTNDWDRIAEVIAEAYWTIMKNKAAVANAIVNGDIGAVAGFFDDTPLLSDIMNRLYQLSDLEKMGLLMKLLTSAQGGVLMDDSNYPRLEKIIMKQMKGSKNEREMMRLAIRSVLSNEKNRDKTALAIANTLRSIFLNGGAQTLGRRSLQKAMQEHYWRELHEENNKKKETQKKINYVVNFLMLSREELNRNISRMTPEALAVIGEKRKVVADLQKIYGYQPQARELTDWQKIKVQLGIRQAEKVESVDVLLRIAEALGSVGVRFLQVMGQYLQLTPEYERAFKQVYDQASPLYYANAFDSMKASIDRLQREIDRLNKDLSAASSLAQEEKMKEEIKKLEQEQQSILEFMKDVTIIEKIGGGSIVTVYLVERGDHALQVLKIRNPNLLEQLGSVRVKRDGQGQVMYEEDGKTPQYIREGDVGLVHHILTDMKREDIERAGDYDMALRLLETIQDWISEDVNDTEFIELDEVYSQQHANYYTSQGVRIGVSKALQPYTKDVKVESFVEGITLNKYLADFKSLSVLEQQKRTKMVEAVIEDFFRHLDQPVRLRDGRSVYITHSDLHPGNVMINPATLELSLIDRNYYLVLEQQDQPVIDLLMGKQPGVSVSDPWWAIGNLKNAYRSLVALMNYVVMLPNNNRLLPLKNQLVDRVLRALIAGRKFDLLTAVNTTFRVLDEAAEEVGQITSPVPLRLRILLKNMISIQGMIRNSKAASLEQIVQRVSTAHQNTQQTETIDRIPAEIKPNGLNDTTNSGNFMGGDGQVTTGNLNYFEEPAKVVANAVEAGALINRVKVGSQGDVTLEEGAVSIGDRTIGIRVDNSMGGYARVRGGVVVINLKGLNQHLAGAQLTNEEKMEAVQRFLAHELAEALFIQQGHSEADAHIAGMMAEAMVSRSKKVREALAPILAERDQEQAKEVELKSNQAAVGETIFRVGNGAGNAPFVIKVKGISSPEVLNFIQELVNHLFFHLPATARKRLEAKIKIISFGGTFPNMGEEPGVYDEDKKTVYFSGELIASKNPRLIAEVFFHELGHVLLNEYFPEIDEQISADFLALYALGNEKLQIFGNRGADEQYGQQKDRLEQLLGISEGFFRTTKDMILEAEKSWYARLNAKMNLPTRISSTYLRQDVYNFAPDFIERLIDKYNTEENPIERQNILSQLDSIEKVLRTPLKELSGLLFFNFPRELAETIEKQYNVFIATGNSSTPDNDIIFSLIEIKEKNLHVEVKGRLSYINVIDTSNHNLWRLPFIVNYIISVINWYKESGKELEERGDFILAETIASSFNMGEEEKSLFLSIILDAEEKTLIHNIEEYRRAHKENIVALNALLQEKNMILNEIGFERYEERERIVLNNAFSRIERLSSPSPAAAKTKGDAVVSQAEAAPSFHINGESYLLQVLNDARVNAYVMQANLLGGVMNYPGCERDVDRALYLVGKVFTDISTIVLIDPVLKEDSIKTLKTIKNKISDSGFVFESMEGSLKNLGSGKKVMIVVKNKETGKQVLLVLYAEDYLKFTPDEIKQSGAAISLVKGMLVMKEGSGIENPILGAVPGLYLKISRDTRSNGLLFISQMATPDVESLELVSPESSTAGISIKGGRRRPLVEQGYWNIYLNKGLPAILASDSAQPAAASPEVSRKKADSVVGGIDFRFLPIVTQSMDNLKASIRSIPASSLRRMDLTQEWSDIERLVNSGITPSAERLKDYLAASCFKGNYDNDMERIVSCISDILRMEEQSCSLTDPTLKDILVVLGSGRSGEELKLALAN